MANYAKAASDWKARWAASAKRTGHLLMLLDLFKAQLSLEVERANSALAREALPLIELNLGPPIELTCVGCTYRVSIDFDEYSIKAKSIKGKSEMRLSFQILENELPDYPFRAFVLPDSGDKVGPQEIASIIVEELIAGL